jgi:hypothetical protein
VATEAGCSCSFVSFHTNDTKAQAKMDKKKCCFNVMGVGEESLNGCIIHLPLFMYITNHHQAPG